MNFILLLSLFLLTGIAQAQQCNIKGECHLSTGVGKILSGSYNDCLKSCQTHPFECNWFTYYSTSKDCIFFSNCLDVDDSTCSDCISGESTCQLQEPMCDVTGFCSGNLIDVLSLPSNKECLQECKNVPNCAWYTFDSLPQLCYLSADCSQGLDTDCATCLSGEVTCPMEEETWSKLMVIGGYPSSVYGDIEVIDLSSQSSICVKPLDFPNQRAHVATYIKGKAIMVCGGQDAGGDYTNKCFFYSKNTNTWDQGPSMNQSRAEAAGVMINETTWWITGGYNGNTLRTSEMYNTANGLWTTYVDMPKIERTHCLLKVNDIHFFMVGGVEQGQQAYLFDIRTEIWTRMADASLERLFATCGVISRQNGAKEIVLAGGGPSPYSSSQIFSLNSLSWRTGRILPSARELALGLQYGPTFIAVGGQGSNDLYDTILQYDEVNDAWKGLEQHLETARGVYTALLVPDDAVNCS